MRSGSHDSGARRLIGQASRFTGVLIGIDLGTKTIGLALWMSKRRIGLAAETLKKRAKFNPGCARKSPGIVTRFDVAAIVVGLPPHMDGSAGRAQQSRQSFMRNLRRRYRPVPSWGGTSGSPRWRLTAPCSKSGCLARARRGQLVDKLPAASYICKGRSTG